MTNHTPASRSAYVSTENESKRLDDFVELTPEATIIVDQDGLIALANEQAAAMFQYPRTELTGKSVENLIPAILRKTHFK